MSKIFDHAPILDVDGKTIAWSFGAATKLFIKPEHGVVNIYAPGWNEYMDRGDRFAIKVFSVSTVWKAARFCRYMLTGKDKHRF